MTYKRDSDKEEIKAALKEVLIENRDEFQEAAKDAVNQWLKDQFAAFGKWTALGLASAAFYVMVKIFVLQGWWPK